jgi:hypothetical protein
VYLPLGHDSTRAAAIDRPDQSKNTAAATQWITAAGEWLSQAAQPPMLLS